MKTAIFILVAASYVLLLIFAYVNWNRAPKERHVCTCKDEKEVTTDSELYTDGSAIVTTVVRYYKVPVKNKYWSDKLGDWEQDVNGNIRRIR